MPLARTQAPGRMCGGQGVCRGPAGTEFWPFAVARCDTRAAEVDFVSRSTFWLLKMPFKTPQPESREWLLKKLGKLDNLDRVVTPLAEHLSPISTPGFLMVCVLVRNIISTAARDAKTKRKHWISRDTRLWKHEYNSRSQKKRPSSTKAQKALTGPQADIRAQKFIILVLQLISWGTWQLKHACATYSHNPRVWDILEEFWGMRKESESGRSNNTFSLFLQMSADSTIRSFYLARPSLASFIPKRLNFRRS